MKIKKRAFTLTEILVIITIIVILMGVVIVATEDSRKLARDKRRMSDFAGYQVALQEYYAKHKKYPSLSKEECNSVPGCSYNEDVKSCGCDISSDNCDSSNPNRSILCVLTTDPQNKYLEKLPLDPINDTAENTKYIYTYASYNDGKDYKMAVPLEKDKQAMENDGGSDTALYEIFSTMGASLAINYWTGVGFQNPLQCNLCSVSGNTCGNSCDTTGKKKIVLKMSGPSNAHAEEPSQSNYNCAIECSGPADFNVAFKSSGSCESNQKEFQILKLSANTNAHVGKSTYANSLCLTRSSGGTANCRITDKCNSTAGEVCVVSISNDDNAHVASCDDNTYNKKVCCLIK